MALLMETPCKFSQLKYLVLWLILDHKDAANILSWEALRSGAAS
jgi:hypothetical protein